MKRIFVSLLLILLSHNVWGYITEDIISGSDSSTLNADNNNTTNMMPVFTINQYTCSAGQFLPADTLGCQSCPNGYTCSGGTFDFNETQTQGLEKKQYITQSTQYTCSTNFLNADNNNTTNIIPVFTPNQYTCSAGYYLPADTDGCRPCLKDNKCVGGTYTFNETTNQGIEPCPSSAPHAPAGSSVCYPHIMHLSNERPNDVIYLKSVATTSPALNIDMNNDGIADVFANMTTNQTYMTSVSEHYLKIMVNGVLYYVCDDTTCPQQN